MLLKTHVDQDLTFLIKYTVFPKQVAWLCEAKKASGRFHL